MTVKELIKVLKKFDGNMTVRIESNAVDCNVARDILDVEEVQEDEAEYGLTDKIVLLSDDIYGHGIMYKRK